jgi:hypothetical protein
MVYRLTSLPAGSLLANGLLVDSLPTDCSLTFNQVPAISSNVSLLVNSLPARGLPARDLPVDGLLAGGLPAENVLAGVYRLTSLLADSLPAGSLLVKSTG